MHRERLLTLADEAAWREALLSIPHAFAHTWDYLQALSHSLPNDLRLYVFDGANGRGLCPLLERSWNGRTDVVTPYGFNGFAIAGETAELPDRWRRFATERGWVCGYLGLNPALPNPPDESGEPDRAVYLVDVTKSPAELFEGLSRNVKTRLREWQRSGARIIDDRERARRFFIDNYRDFTRRVGAGTPYHFSPITLDGWTRLERVWLLGAENGSGRLEAVSVFAASDYCGEYLFNVSLPEGRGHSAALLWEGMLRLRSEGVPVVNLGGGVTAGDGLDQFKARFGGFSRPLRALKQVYRPDVYEECCRRAGVDPRSRSGYFPPYRTVKWRVE
ncbi:MAG TPA: hypothetical protein VJ302_14995 [Blastocatellia bacterium]|nr:hypothetical protein [Blastocatellia bacterium]